MSCIKTGAGVYLPEYNTTVVCDIFATGDCVIINFDPKHFHSTSNRKVTHEAVIAGGYFNPSKGLIVIPSRRLTAAEDF